MSMLAQMTWGQWSLAVLLISVCCFLMLVILLQRGRGGGLVGAFGGAGGSSAFGAKTGDVFTWITVIVATLFVVLAVLGNYAFDESATPTRAVTLQTGAPAETDETPSDSDTAGDLVIPETGDAIDATGTTTDPDEGVEEEPSP